MKTKRTFKPAGVILCFALVISLVCALGIMSSAAEGDATLEIGLTNLRYDKQTDIIVTVSGDAPDGYVKGIAVWNNDVEGELTKENISYTNFMVETVNEVDFYATSGIAADDLSKDITIAPVIMKDGEITIAGALVKKSLIGYVNERLTEDELEGYQIELYRDLVVYGTAAEKVIDGTNTKSVVVAKNGYVGNKYLPIVVADGETAMLRASAVNAKGDYFSHWEDAAGNVVSGERLCNVTVAEGLNYYNAVYTSKSTSAYGYFADFQQFELGEQNWTVADLTDAQKTAGKSAHALPLFTNSSGSTLGISKRYLLDADKIATAEPTDVISSTTADILDVKETYDGVNYLNWNTLVSSAAGSNDWVTLMDTRGKTEQLDLERLELDLSVKTTGLHYLYIRYIGKNNATHHFGINRKNNADGVNCLYISCYTTGVELFIDDNGGKDVVTLGFEIDAATGEGNIYVNGVKTTYGTYTAGGYNNPTQIQISTEGTASSWDIYNYGMVDADKVKASNN